MKKKYILLLMLLLIIIISICLIYRNNNKEDTDIKVKYPIYEYYKLNKVITENINYYLKDNIDNYYFLYIDYKDYEYKEYISIVLYISYFTGGAHPNYEIKTINYNKNTNILNGYIRKFPSNLIAKFNNFKIKPFFTVSSLTHL